MEPRAKVVKYSTENLIVIVYLEFDTLASSFFNERNIKFIQPILRGVEAQNKHFKKLNGCGFFSIDAQLKNRIARYFVDKVMTLMQVTIFEIRRLVNKG